MGIFSRIVGINAMKAIIKVAIMEIRFERAGARKKVASIIALKTQRGTNNVVMAEVGIRTIGR